MLASTEGVNCSSCRSLQLADGVVARSSQRLRSFYGDPAACFVQAGLEDGDNLYVKLDELTLSLRKRGGGGVIGSGR